MTVVSVQSTKDARALGFVGPYALYTGHSSPEIFIKTGLFSESVLEKQLSFAVVRNPFERLISVFHHFQKHADYGQDVVNFLREIESVRVSAKSDFERRLLRMSLPMSFWTHPGGWQGPSRLLSFASLNSELARLARDLNVPAPTESVGTSGAGLNRRILTEEAAEKIRELYKMDFETLGFDLEVPKKLQLF